jgi:hypothetical protein
MCNPRRKNVREREEAGAQRQPQNISLGNFALILIKSHKSCLLSVNIDRMITTSPTPGKFPLFKLAYSLNLKGRK